MKHLPLAIVPVVSLLFFLVSKRALHGVGDGSQLFTIFIGVSNTIAFVLPVMIFIFYLLTSSLMFNILDEKMHAGRMANVICLSFIPVFLSAVVYLLMLYDINPIGLTVSDMEIVSNAAWVGFFITLFLMIKEEFQLSFFKAAAISLFPTMLVMAFQLVF